jgi:hypothetical protein
MTSLLEKAGKVSALLAKYKNVASHQGAVGYLRTRDRQVTEILESLERLAHKRAVLEAVEAISGPGKKASAALIKKCQALADLVDRDWQEFSQDNSFFTNFKTPCADFSDSSSKALLASWRKYSSALMARVPSGLIATAPRDDLGMSLRALVARAENLAEKFPSNVAEARELRDLVEKIVAMADQIEKMPEAVKKFLQEAGSQGAKFEDLTDEVRTWLEERDRMGQLRIRTA